MIILYRTHLLFISMAALFPSLTSGFAPSSQAQLLVGSTISCRTIFSSSPSLLGTGSTTSTTAGVSLQMANNKNMEADFEYQELNLKLRSMQEQKVSTTQLMESTRAELEGYIRKILTRRTSAIPLYQVGNHLPGTTWRLAYSTQPATAESLPSGVEITLAFRDESRLDYSLGFSKTFGLNKLTAESTYQIDSSPVSPGLLTYTYDKISTDVFGLRNIGLGMMGLLKGRSSQIQTQYFDDLLWIEVGRDRGYEWFNVYIQVNSGGSGQGSDGAASITGTKIPDGSNQWD